MQETVDFIFIFKHWKSICRLLIFIFIWKLAQVAFFLVQQTQHKWSIHETRANKAWKNWKSVCDCRLDAADCCWRFITAFFGSFFPVLPTLCCKHRPRSIPGIKKIGNPCLLIADAMIVDDMKQEHFLWQLFSGFANAMLQASATEHTRH